MRTITFYSYKGGTGRTLLLANTACFLARAGQHVVMLDFDLEAPGLHNKFECSLPPKLTPGIPIDRDEVKDRLREIGPGSVDILYKWQYEHSVSVDGYIYDVTPGSVEGQGRVELIPAGPAPSLHYANSLRELDWVALRECFDAGDAVQLFKDDLQDRGVDYLLVDARTGITDIGALALHGIFDDDKEGKDKTVCLFTTTPESINGIALVMAGLMDSHGREFVVPTLARVPSDSLEDQKLLKKVSSQLQAAASGTNDDSDSDFKIEQDELVWIRSDPTLQLEEEILIENDGRTVRESMIVLDYLRLFERLELPTNIFPDKTQQVIKLYRNHSIFTLRKPVTRTKMLKQVRERGLQYKTPSDVSSPSYKSFMEHVVKHVCDVAGVSLPSQDNAQHLRDLGFDVVALRMRDSMLDITGDQFYLTPARSEIVDILPFGKVERYGFVVKSANDDPISSPNKFTGEQKSLSFEQDLLPSLKTELSDFDIGLLAETSATSEAFPQMRGHVDEKRIFIAPSKETLRNWIKENKKAVIVADLDVFSAVRLLDSVHQLEYSRKYKAGIACPLGDTEWKRILAEAVSSYLAGNTASRKKWTEVVTSLKEIGIHPFDREELVRELLLDMSHSQAVDWLDKLRGFLVESEEEVKTVVN